MIKKFYILLFVFICFKSNAGLSQASCSGSLGDPIVNITFGQGSNPGAPFSTSVPGALTSYIYSAPTGNPASNTVFDGQYALVNSVPSNPFWLTGADHTNNGNGYMAFFNAAPTPGDFYSQTVTGLCAGTTYEFAAWILNAVNSNLLPNAVPPNVTFKIFNPANLVTPIISFSTGDIPGQSTIIWRRYSTLFTTPTGINSVLLVLSNNNVGGTNLVGNDMAIDDITFRACGPLTEASFSATSSVSNLSICRTTSYTLYGTVGSGLNTASYQWQISSDNGFTWSNISGANSLNYTTTGNITGAFKFRLQSQEAANINSSFCKFYSSPIDLIVTNCGEGISGVINQYTPVISFGSCKNEILVEDATNYNVGDTVLIIQMKGATIDSSNTANFGTITNYNNAGNYEFNYIKNISGNSISLKNIVTRLYDLPNGKVQLIRVPYYDSTKVIATLTCLPWDGKKGGVLAFNVNNKLTLNANIDVSNKGFRGGRSLNQFNTSLTCFFNDFTYPSGTIQAAEKGESIYNIGSQNGSAKGNNANGGGGGNGHNSGGGGGGNAGKGGFGGYQLEICGNAPYDNRGLGGKELIYSNASNKIFLGGGGGSGQTDNAGGINMNGGDGGGIILLSANILESNNFQIVSNGQAAQICNNATNNCHDGSGGGGGGGSILLSVNNYTSNANVNVRGGKGGDLVIYNNLGAGRIGTGGGGGGGVIWVKQASLPTTVIASVNAGSNGSILQDNNNPWGATSGLNGQILNSLILPIDNVPFQPKIDSIRFLNQNTSCSNFTFSGLNYPIATPINNWQWTFGDGTSSSSQNTQHTYITSGTFQVTLVATEPTGCKDSTTQTITTTALQVDAGNDSTFCADTKNVFLNTTTNQTGVTYNWISTATLSNNNIANPTATIDTTTTFYVTVSLPNGCSTTDSVKVNLNKFPIVKTLKDTAICRGAVLVLTSTAGLDAYQWTNGLYVSDSTIANPSFIDTASQILYLSGTQNGCTSKDTINILVNPNPIVRTISDTIVCSTQTINLTTTGANTYSWFPTNNLDNANAASPAFMGSNTSTYYVTGTLSATGCKNIDTLSITVNIPNSFVQPPSKSVCTKEYVVLDGYNGLNAQYTWSGPNISNPLIINPRVNPLTTTNYQVSIFDRYCNTTQNFTVPVNVLPLPLITTQKSNDVNCIVPSSELLAMGALKYLWTPAETLNDSTIRNPLATPSSNTTYTVSGTDNNGCMGKNTITVNKDNSFGIIDLPNIFTPNKDTKNDCFKVLVKGQIKNYTLLIFNRWGEKVFESHNSNDCWNGKHRGMDAETGNYVYYLTAKTLCGDFSKKGNVILMR